MTMTIFIGLAVLAALALFAAPSISWNPPGNILGTGTSIAAGGSNSGNIVDFSSNCFGGWVMFTNTGGVSVSATNGLRADVYPAGDNGPNYATTVLTTITIATVASSVRRQAIWLGPGKYSITLTNLDASNSMAAGITSAPYA